MDIFDQLANDDMSSVDTSFPLLAPDTYEFTITNIELKTSQNTGGSYISMSLALSSEGALTPNGDPVGPGYPVTHMISTSTTEKMSEEDIKRNIAQFMDAVVGKSARESGVHFDVTLESYKQQTLIAKTKNQPERVDKNTGETYAPRTVVSYFIPKD